MKIKQTILIAPLDWGLGHATRCIPLIRQFVLENHTVILAGQGSSLSLLQQEFPNLQTLHLKGYKVSYSSSGLLFLKLLLQMPLWGISIIIEHLRLRSLVKKLGVTTVVSDNRYGLWHPKTLNVLISHQLFIKLPHSLKWLEPTLHQFTRILIQRFHECWVPDFEDYNLSLAGDLSHGKILPKNVKYIGPLSRFYRYEPPTNENMPTTFPDILVLISAPEPFRSVFQQQMIMHYSQTEQQVLLVCGQPNNNSKPPHNPLPTSEKLKHVPHLSTPELYFYLKHTPQIISLSGYSTLMDLYALQRTAELIATPGQTEQEYLAEWWSKRKNTTTNQSIRQ